MFNTKNPSLHEADNKPLGTSARRCSMAVPPVPEIIEVRRSQVKVADEKLLRCPGSTPPKSHRYKSKRLRSSKLSRTPESSTVPLPFSEWYPSSALIDPRLTKDEAFLLLYGRALMTYGCPLRQVESQVTNIAQFLEVNIEIIRLPAALLFMFFDRSVELTPRRTARKHYLKVGGKLNLAKLHEIEKVITVVHRQYSNIESASDRLLQIGVRLRGGTWSTGLTRQIECLRFALQGSLDGRPRPILALRRMRWEQILKATHKEAIHSPGSH